MECQCSNKLGIANYCTKTRISNCKRKKKVVIQRLIFIATSFMNLLNRITQQDCIDLSVWFYLYF
jgi:hypothetical protein